METKANTPFYADKSLWAAVLPWVLIPLGKKLGVQFDVTEIAALVATLVAFIGGNKWKSAAVTIAEVKAEAAKTVASEPIPHGATATDLLAKAAK